MTPCVPDSQTPTSEGIAPPPCARCRQPRPSQVPRSRPVRAGAGEQRAPRLLHRNPLLLRRRTRTPGGAGRADRARPPAGEPTPAPGPAAVPAESHPAGPPTPPHRNRRHQLVDTPWTTGRGARTARRPSSPRILERSATSNLVWQLPPPAEQVLGAARRDQHRRQPPGIAGDHGQYRQLRRGAGLPEPDRQLDRRDHRSCWPISPATYCVREAGSGGR